MKIPSAAATVAVALALSACTTGPAAPPAPAPTSAPAPTTMSTPATSPSPDTDESDTAFAQALVTHEQQAVEMSDMALDGRHDAAPEVQQLAASTRRQVITHLADLHHWLDLRKPAAETATPTRATDPADNTPGGNAPEDDLEAPASDTAAQPASPGPTPTPAASAPAPDAAIPSGTPTLDLIDPGAMEDLAATRGAQFDRLWLSMMTTHQSATLAAAEHLQSRAGSAEIRSLAERIARQTRPRLDRMQTVAAELSGSADGGGTGAASLAG